VKPRTIYEMVATERIPYRKPPGSSGLSLEGQAIRLIGKNRTYVAKTDKNGVYELYDLPPGRYVLEPELTFGWKVDEFSLTRPPTRTELRQGHRPCNKVAFTLRPRRHFGIDIRLELSNQRSDGTFRSANDATLHSRDGSSERRRWKRYD
jgi:hypothetical protein